MEKMLRAVNCVNMWPISPLRALKHLHPSFSRTLHGHVRQPENWSWNLLIMKTSSGFMTWYTDPGMGSGIWNESVSTIPHTESQNHPCRLSTKTNKTQDERFPGCHAARRHLTVKKKTCTHWGMECKWCFCGYPFISNITTAGGREEERAVEEKRVREWKRSI